MFSSLSHLNTHLSFLRTQTSQQHLFLVWWCVRDLLLGITTDPTDIDVTLYWHPQDIKKTINQSGISFFMTEKYGTMTLIKKWSDETPTYSYEITPFRGEWDYSDARHPDEINREATLLDDAQRRDFTINSLYYTNIGKAQYSQSTPHPRSLSLEERDVSSASPFSSKEKGWGWGVLRSHDWEWGVDEKKQEKFISTLQKVWARYDGPTQTMILTQPSLIQQFLDAQWDWEQYKQWCQSFFTNIDRKEIQWIAVVIDPTMWIIDLLNGKLCAVGDADLRLKEDALRIIRALRFVTVLNPQLPEKASFDIEKKTRRALQKRYFLVRTLPCERIKQEMDKVFTKWTPFGFVALCDEINILQYIFPALYQNKNVNQPIRYHPFDVYTHCLMTLFHLQSFNIDRLTRYAMLYHDVGKREQYHTYNMGLDGDGVREMFGTWLNHSVCGADMTTTDFKALWFSKKDISTISRYVANHMKPGEILMSKPRSRKKKIRSFVSEVWPEMVHNLLDITIADRLWQYNPLQPPQNDDVQILHDLVDEIMADEWRFMMSDLAINGNDLMDYCKKKGWPRLRSVLAKIFERVSHDIASRNVKAVILKEVSSWMKNEEI